MIHPKFAYGILCSSFPLLGLNMRMQSSFQPLIMYLPLFGRHKDMQTTFGKVIFIIGVNYFVLHIIISFPEQVPNKLSKSGMSARSFICEVCAEYHN